MDSLLLPRYRTIAKCGILSRYMRFLGRSLANLPKLAENFKFTSFRIEAKICQTGAIATLGLFDTIDTITRYVEWKRVK